MLCRAVPDPSRPLPNPTRDCGRDIRCGRFVASLDSPGLAPVVGVITPQLKNGSTRNLTGESGWKRTSRRRKTRNYREFQRADRKIGLTTARVQAAVWAAARDWEIFRSQILGRSFFNRTFERQLAVHPRPTPTYSNPMARSRAESSRFLVSTMMGFLSRCLIRSKSSARNSGQPVPTTRASMPSAAA